MGSLYRSEEMTLCQLFLQSEAAYACVSELGELGLVQFRDLNPDVNAFQRKFVNEVRRCDEMERKLRFLEKEIKKDGIPMLDTGDNPDAPAPREMVDLEATFEKLENEMKEVNANSEALKRNYLELTELKHILRKTQAFFEEAELLSYDHQALSDTSISEETVGLLGEEGLRAGGQGLRLGFVAGVIHRERIPAFERMLWRACRGNVFLKQTEIDTPLEDPVTGDQVNKSVFIIFFQGDQLKTRVKKICEGFRATLYPCPETPAERREMAIGVMTRIEDLNTVLGQTQDHRHRVLVAAAKNIKVWFIKVRKIKAIYHTLNMFNLDVTQKCLIAECWCPVGDLDKIQLALRRGTERSGSSVPSILNRMVTKEDPPTFFRTNKFTSCFQSIVDAYGVASYREINPAPFTIITFPFLFSVMFGDAGHGLIMFLFGLYLVLKEKQLGQIKTDNEIWNTFFGGRYLIMMMGAFSIYSGLMYNDIFSLSLNLFGSTWYAPEKQFNLTTVINNNPLLQLDPAMSDNFYQYPYPFGIDPIWAMSQNAITFLDSFKMKLSIVLAVTHMTFGLSLRFFNNRYFHDKINLFCEFVPQIIFFECIFGYLVILVFYKMLAFDATNSRVAPSLLIHLINMFLFKYPDDPVSAKQFYAGQKGLQSFLLFIAFICVPWMLLLKPFLLRRQNQQKSLTGQRERILPTPPPSPHIDGGVDMASETQTDFGKDYPSSHGDSAGDSYTPMAHELDHEEEFNFADIFVYQCIHTIEFCLNCISHTASYLRLWALSLAHAELSQVLWDLVMRIGLKMSGYGGSIAIFIVFAFWASLSVGILLLMEGLSAFLHTIRLHWVEFQSKFYKGTGVKFLPFNFDELIDIRGPEE